VSHKFAIIPCKTKKTTQLLGIPRYGPISDRLNFGWVRSNSSGTDHVAQIGYLLLCKPAFGELDLPLVPSQQKEHFAEVNQMVVKGFTVYQYVVKKDESTATKKR
jgi:hypothetical protein